MGMLKELQGNHPGIIDPALISFILNAINSSILVVDHKDRLVLFNSRARDLFGQDMLRIGSYILEKIFMPDDIEILLHNILVITRSKGEFEGEVMLRRSDGSTFIALMSTSAWPWEDGHAIVITLHDISRLKGIEKLLRDSERMAFLGGMLDDISHQIRNPVLAIGGFSRRLAKTSQERPEYLHAIQEEASRLENLLDVLTEFIRFPPQMPQHVSLESLPDSLEPVFQEIREKYGIGIEVDISRELSSEPAFVDIAAVRRAVLEILKNSAEEAAHCSHAVNVKVSFCNSDEQLMSCIIKVIDNGSGIRPPIFLKIFNPFFTTKTGHAGMGLTLARRIIQEAAGRLVIESEYGQGTTALIHLPRDRRREIRRKKLHLS